MKKIKMLVLVSLLFFGIGGQISWAAIPGTMGGLVREQSLSSGYFQPRQVKIVNGLLEPADFRLRADSGTLGRKLIAFSLKPGKSRTLKLEAGIHSLVTEHLAEGRFPRSFISGFKLTGDVVARFELKKEGTDSDGEVFEVSRSLVKQVLDGTRIYFLESGEEVAVREWYSFRLADFWPNTGLVTVSWNHIILSALSGLGQFRAPKYLNAIGKGEVRQLEMDGAVYELKYLDWRKIAIPSSITVRVNEDGIEIKTDSTTINN